MWVLPKGRESSQVTSAGRPAPADDLPSAAAELRIELRRDGRQDEGGPTAGSRLPSWLRWLVPAAIGLRVTVPGADSVPLLRMLEHVTFAIAWPTAVIGTLFGASAAHLPPIGTTIVVMLEVVIPAVVLLGGHGRSDK